MSISLREKVRTFFAAEPQKCKFCTNGREYVFDHKLTMDVVDMGECPHCKGTGMVH